MKIKNKTILITGGASGIGLAFAEVLSDMGNTVLICGRSEGKLKEAKRLLPNINIYIADLSLEASRLQLFQNIQSDGYDVDILINNAGILSPQDFENVEGESFKRIRDEIETNLIAPVELVNFFLKNAILKKESAIINVSSPAGVIPIAQTPGYSLSKSGLHSFTQTLRYQLKNTNVKVIEVFPPSVETKMAEHNGRKNMDCIQFAKKAVSKIEKGKHEVWIGEAYVVRLFSKLPRIFSFNLINAMVPIHRNT